MKKLELKIDELAVESFDTAEQGDEARGTVRGNWTRYPGTCIQPQCGAECPSGPQARRGRRRAARGAGCGRGRAAGGRGGGARGAGGGGGGAGWGGGVVGGQRRG